MLVYGLDLDAHRARLLNETHVATAALLIAVDSGVARVLRIRYVDAKVFGLGELAGRQRDIPDPFRMQVGAWLHYAGEIEQLLIAGLPRLRQLLKLEAQAAPAGLTPAPLPTVLDAQRPPPVALSAEVSVLSTPAAADRVAATLAIEPTRLSIVGRLCRLLALYAELPATVVWPAARHQIEADLALLTAALTPGDLAQPYVALLQAMLNLIPNPPDATQALALHEAVLRLQDPVGPTELATLAQALKWLDER